MSMEKLQRRRNRQLINWPSGRFIAQIANRQGRERYPHHEFLEDGSVRTSWKYSNETFALPNYIAMLPAAIVRYILELAEVMTFWMRQLSVPRLYFKLKRNHMPLFVDIHTAPLSWNLIWRKNEVRREPPGGVEIDPYWRRKRNRGADPLLQGVYTSLQQTVGPDSPNHIIIKDVPQLSEYFHTFIPKVGLGAPRIRVWDGL